MSRLRHCLWSWRRQRGRTSKNLTATCTSCSALQCLRTKERDTWVSRSTANISASSAFFTALKKWTRRHTCSMPFFKTAESSSTRKSQQMIRTSNLCSIRCAHLQLGNYSLSLKDLSSLMKSTTITKSFSSSSKSNPSGKKCSSSKSSDTRFASVMKNSSSRYQRSPIGVLTQPNYARKCWP